MERITFDKERHQHDNQQSQLKGIDSKVCETMLEVLVSNLKRLMQKTNML